MGSELRPGESLSSIVGSVRVGGLEMDCSATYPKGTATITRKAINKTVSVGYCAASELMVNAMLH